MLSFFGGAVGLAEHRAAQIPAILGICSPLFAKSLPTNCRNADILHKPMSTKLVFDFQVNVHIGNTPECQVLC